MTTAACKEVLQPSSSSLFIYYKRKVMNWTFNYSKKKSRKTEKKAQETKRQRQQRSEITELENSETSKGLIKSVNLFWNGLKSRKENSRET